MDQVSRTATEVNLRRIGQQRASECEDRAGQRPAPKADDVAALRDALASQSHELATLYAALNQVHHGVILFDRDMRAQFMNRAVRNMFNSPDALVESKPTYIELLQHASSSSTYAVARADLDKYIAHRLALVVAGDSTTHDQRLSNGKILRSQCAILPGGGRMLTHTDVTDLILHAEELERLATIDGMTGIYNRRHFLALADRAWERSQRHDRPLSLLMMDIDFFKSINDRFGHDTGDRVIVHLANLARGSKRESDVLARLGGEEFALLLPDTGIEQAHAIAERLRRDVATGPLVAGSDLISTTVSIGVAAAVGRHSAIPDLMKAADLALYEAKNAGRNRVVLRDAAPIIASPSLGAPARPDAAHAPAASGSEQQRHEPRQRRASEQEHPIHCIEAENAAFRRRT